MRNRKMEKLKIENLGTGLLPYDRNTHAAQRPLRTGPPKVHLVIGLAQGAPAGMPVPQGPIERSTTSPHVKAALAGTRKKKALTTEGGHYRGVFDGGGSAC